MFVSSSAMVVEILSGSESDNTNPKPVINEAKRDENVTKPRPRKEYEPDSSWHRSRDVRTYLSQVEERFFKQYCRVDESCCSLAGLGRLGNYLETLGSRGRPAERTLPQPSWSAIPGQLKATITRKIQLSEPARAWSVWEAGAIKSQDYLWKRRERFSRQNSRKGIPSCISVNELWIRI